MSVVPVGKMGGSKGKVSSIGARIGAIPGQIIQTVSPGGKVRLWRIDFTYTGPAQTLYACWGLKRKGLSVNFNNGDGLQGGSSMFAAYGIPVEQATNRAYTYIVDAVYTVPSDTPEATYDVFVWISRLKSASEASILRIDTDASIVKVEVPAPSVSVSNMQAGYQKV